MKKKKKKKKKRFFFKKRKRRRRRRRRKCSSHSKAHAGDEERERESKGRKEEAEWETFPLLAIPSFDSCSKIGCFNLPTSLRERSGRERERRKEKKNGYELAFVDC